MVVSLYVTAVMRRSSVLESRGTAPMCHGRECARSTSTLRWSESVEVYIPPGPHQGAPVVFGYTYLHVKDVHLIYIGTYTYKYIEHESANWLGCGGRRATPIDVERHTVSDVGGGIVETLPLTVIVTRASPYDGTGTHTTLDLMHVHNSLGHYVLLDCPDHLDF